MSKEKLLNGAIVLGVIVAAVLAGFIFAPQQKQSSSDSALSLTSHSFESVEIKTNLTKELTQEFYSFLTTTTKASAIPAEITLALTTKGKDEQGDVYTASWNKDGKFVSVLFVLTSDNKHLNYQRIWIMPIAESVNDTKANSLLSDIFQPTFLSDIGPVKCSTVLTPPNNSLTECGKMKTAASGNLFGVTVRTPITLPPPPGVSPPPTSEAPPPVTIVSACFVPKEGTPVYTSPTCI